MHAIPVSATNRRDIVQSLKRARNELDNGHIVCIFAEGAISRTGNMLPFKRGFEKIVEGTDMPDRAGSPRSALGQHLQLQGRAIFLEMAEAHSLSRDRRLSARRCAPIATAQRSAQCRP